MPAGRYAITTEVDLTRLPDWEASVDDAVRPVQDMSDRPMGTILGEKFNDQIPKGLEGKFREWFNGEVVHGSRVDLAKLEQSMKSMLGKFQISSTLEVAGGHATHTVTGLAFDFGTQHVDVDLPDVTETLPIRAGALGAHQFTLPFGELGAGALDSRVESGLRAVIGKIIDCSRVAQNVAKKCNGALCVGHQQEIEEICTAGLDAVTGLALASVKKLRIDPLRLTGSLDANLEGMWTASVDLGAGPKELVSKFWARSF
jgi:hypothetical protein